MWKESVELTLSHVGLGHLSEVAALLLFANARAHALTAGLDTSQADITDVHGRPLYPAYYWTWLRVPPTRLLSRHRVWSRVDVAVDVRAYGGMLLDTRYVLAPGGTPIPDAPDTWAGLELTTMHAGSVFVAEHRGGEGQVALPDPRRIAPLGTLKSQPESMARFDDARARRPVHAHPARIRVGLDVRLGRDAAPGCDLTFAKLIELAMLAEHQLLLEHHRCPRSLLERLEIVERETFYLDNARAGEDIEVEVSAAVLRPEIALSEGTVLGAALELVSEVRQRPSHRTLAISRSRGLFALPVSAHGAIRDAARVFGGCA